MPSFHFSRSIEASYKQALRFLPLLFLLIIPLRTYSITENGNLTNLKDTKVIHYTPLTVYTAKHIPGHLNTQQNLASQQSSTPTIVIDSGGMGHFYGSIGGEHIQYYTVDFYNFPKGQPATLEVNTSSGAFEISTDKYSGYSTSIELLPNPDGTLEFAQIFVRYRPSEDGEHAATITHSSINATTETLSLTGFSSSAPLPLELVSFRADLMDSKVLLNWAAAPDEERTSFEIEVSNNPADGFKKAGIISCVDRNSSETISYSFMYNPGSRGGTHYFRIGQVYNDKSILYSTVISVEVPPLLATKAIVSPNPFSTSSQLKINATETGMLKIVLSNLAGTEILSKSYEVVDGENNLILNTNPAMPAGIYILSTELNGTANRLKLIKE